MATESDARFARKLVSQILTGGTMPDHQDPFKPLDPGRINAMDPIELQYWCTELKCTEVELRTAIAAVGEHVTAVREQLGSGSSTR